MATEKRLIDANAFECVCVNGKSDDFCDGVLYVLDMIDAQPTVDAVEVVHSRFVRVADFGDGEGCFGHCEKCGTVHHSQSPVALKADYRWCRWCGAKMDGDGNET